MKKFCSLLLVICLAVSVFTAASAETSPIMEVTNCTEYVSLRKTPDTSSTRLLKVYKGELVYFLDTAENGFLKCSCQGREGYILSKYLKTTPYSAWEAILPNQQVTDCLEYVSLREAPDKSSARLAKVPLGATVTRCLYLEDFIQCTYNGKTGYILSCYLKDAEHTAPAPTPTPTPSPVTPDAAFSSFRFVTSYSAKVQTNTVNGTVYLRWGPGTSYPAMSVIKNGASVTVLAEGAGWYQIRVNSTGYTGFMSSKYIARTW